jgi:hypothetical protein
VVLDAPSNAHIRPHWCFPLYDWFREPCAPSEQHGSIITQQFNVTLTTVIFGRIHEAKISKFEGPSTQLEELDAGDVLT